MKKKKKAIIVDMDGTICENVTGRPWYGEGAADGMMTDAPYTDIINMLRTYLENYEMQLLILTGRNDTKDVRAATLAWLETNWFYPDKLFMRKPGDYSKTAAFKEKTYVEKIEPYYDVIMVFEDNNACVQMFRDKGLLVLQPQNSDY